MSVPIESIVYDYLLVIDTNWHPISYRFEVIADYCLNLGYLELIGATHDVHLGLIGKRVVDFLLALIELFPLAYVLRLRIYEQISIENQRFHSQGQFDPKF